MIWVIPFLIFFLILLWGFVSSNLILKIPRDSVDFNPKSFGYEFEPFKTLTEDGVVIEGWFIPAKKKTGACVVAMHGWGASRSDILSNTAFLAEHFNLVYFDFRNHGKSGGKKTSLTCLEIKDLESVIRFLKKEKKDVVQQIGLYGFSMGGSVAISAGAKIPEIRAVLAESPFASFNQTVKRFAKLFYGIPEWIVPLTLFFARMRLGFNPEKCSPLYYVSELSPRALMIFQGGADERMPVTEGKMLYEKAKEPRELWIVPQAGHGDISEKVPEEYKEKLLKFFREWLQN